MDLGFEIPNFMTALPEIFVLVMACVVLIVDLYLSDQKRVITYHLSLATLTGAALLTVLTSGGGAELTFSDTFLNDNMARVLKLFIYLITAVVFVYSRDYLVERQLFKGEYFVLGPVRRAGHDGHGVRPQFSDRVSGAWNCCRCAFTPWWRCSGTRPTHRKRP